jgi:16S rRNA (guanine527-N7)-methyltransferase
MAAPDADHLRAAADALGVPLADAQLAQLLAYQDLLARWNRVYNLTAVRDAGRIGSHHLADSLSVVAPLTRHANGRPLRLLDVGSGGGLPGVVLAIARPDWHVDCIDAVAKKAGFVTQVALELGLINLHAHHARVQDLAPAQADVIVSRAFSSLADFAAWTQHHLARGGVWLAMKGKHPADEIAALPPGVRMFHVEPLNVPGLDADRCALWLQPADPATAQSA